MNALDAYKKKKEQSSGSAYTVLMADRIKSGKDTLFDDIMSFGKSSMGDNAYSNYYKGGFKTPDDYTAASDFLTSSVDTVNGYKERLEKNRAAYERVYGAEAVKKQEESLNQMLSLYNSQDLWDSINSRRDVFAQYKDADEYNSLNDMTAGQGKTLDDKISAAQEEYNNALSLLSKAKKGKYISRVKLPDSENQNIDIESAKDKESFAKAELERLKQLKLDWEKARAQYDDEGTPFSEKYNGYDYKGVGLAINALASKEYALSDSQKRELEWLRDNQISYANDEELKNALALAKGQAENAREKTNQMHFAATYDINNPDPFTEEQKNLAEEEAARYQAKAATLENYYNERKENERLAAIEKEVHDKYMPLLDDEEFAKHTTVESDKKSSVYLGSDRTTDVYNNIANVYNAKMTDDERKVFYGLYNTDKEKATKYLDELEPILNKRTTDAWVKVAQEGAEENPVLNSVLAIATNLASGIGSVDALLRKATGKEIDTNSPVNILAHYSSTVRGTTSQMLSDYLRKNPDSFWNAKSTLFGRDEDGNARAFGLFAKETTESMLDNLARIAVSKGVGTGLSEKALETIDFSLMGSQVATQTIIDAKKKGLSDGKALAMGFTSGAIEAITEVWSVERILGNPKSFITTLGKSLVAEGSEEIASNILNRAVDVLVNADQSEVMQEYYGYINEGLSPSEASAKTVSGILGDDLSAGLGGALSGVMMSGANYGIAKSYAKAENVKNGVRQIKVGRELKSADSVITSLDEIIAANPDNKEAVTAREAIEKGEKVSARRLGKLLTDEFSAQYEKAVTDVDSTEVKAKLEQKGVKNADALSKTIAKAFNEGYDSVKGQERTELTHNSEAMEVYKEYQTERENAAENSGRLFRVYSDVDRSELVSYAKEQGKNNSFIREASNLVEGKTDLDSLDNLQEAVFSEITDRFLSADTVEEARTVYKELAKGAGKGIKSLLDTALDNRTEEITAANSYDTVESVSFNETKDGVEAFVSTAKGKNLSPLSANIGYEAAAVINNAADRPSAVRNLYANEYLESNRHLVASTYNASFEKYYKAGENGQSFSEIKRTSRDIKPSSARRIYEAGRAQAGAERNRQEQYKRTAEYKNRSKERTEQNTAAKKRGGVVREYSASKKVSRQLRGQLRLLDVWAKEKGVVIRVVSSLAEKYKLEGKIINGEYAGGNTIVIALDGKNALTSTAGHEMYHMIENLSPEYAQSFRSFVIDHLKAAGKYDSVFADYEKRYGKTYARDEGFKAKIDEEIVADHCFEALTNKEQWDSFAAENKTLSDKIKEFIKEFVAMINRAFDKYFVHDNAEIRNEVLGEVDYMNEIARRLSEGVDEAVENYRFGAGTESETRFSIGYTLDNKAVAIIEDDILAGVPKSEWIKTVKDTISGKFSSGIPVSGRLIKVNRITKNEFTNSKDTKNLKNNKTVYKDKLKSANNLDDIVLASTNYINEDLKHTRKDNFKEFARGDVSIRIGNNDYSAKVIVGFTSGGNMVLYDIINFTPTKLVLNEKKKARNTAMHQNDAGSDRTRVPSDTIIRTNDKKSQGKISSFSISDEEYMSAAESGDTRLAQRMVNEAAGEAGYNSPQLYHGTQNFGFTEFDLNKMGDGRSIFLTSSRDIASTYSGVGGKRNIETPKSSANMTIDEVANALNEVAKRDNGDLDLSSYRVMNQKDLTALERSVDKGIEDLYDTVQKKIDLYGERLARDFNDKDEKTLNRLVDLSDLLEHYSYDKLSTPLYMLLHHSDAFTTEKFELSDLEADVRLMQLLKKNDLSNGVVVAEDKDRYYIRALDKEKAAKLLDEQNALGNYALFAKLGNSLEIDGKGKNWNKIFAVLEPQEKTTLSAKYNTDKNTLVLSDEKGIFAEIKRDTLDEAAPAMARAITNRYGKFLAATVLSQARDQLKNSATAEVQVRAVGDRNTREIAEFAEEQGYDSVVFRDLMDNGGQNSKVASSVTADIYIIFDPNNVKSADPITYDNDGNIIPLSERFNENEKDIRYQISDNAEKDVQALLEGKKFTEDIKLTDSSPRIILGHKGVKNLPMLMKPSHILENILTTEEAEKRGLKIDPEKIHYHGLGKTLFLDVIRSLDDVNQAYRGTKNAADSSRRENYFLLISTLKDTEGNVINVPVYINEQGRYNRVSIDTNKIGTAFGREQLQRYIQKEIKNGNLVRIKKRSSLDSGLTGDKVPDRHNEATSRGGSEVSEKPTTKADDYYSIASDDIILNSTEKSQEKFSKISKKLLTDEVKASISDAGMRLTDDKELSSLLREQAYKEEIDRLKGELVKSKRMGGKGKNRLMKQDINRIARDIISEYSSKIDSSTLRDEITGLYEFMDNAEMQSSADYAELVKRSTDIAKSVIASSYVDITDQNAEDYKAAMRHYRLTPSLKDVAELEGMFGTFGAAYRQYGRKLNMRAQGTPGALHIDEVWDELCNSVPFLDRDAVSTQDMWRNLIEVIDSLDEKNGFNPYITDGDLTANEAAGALGADILERFNEVRADTTFADRAQQRVDLRDKKIAELKAENRKKLAEQRAQRKERIESLKQSFREQNRKSRERRNGTDTKNKIRRVIKNLRSLYLHPTKERNIKKELRPMIEKTLAASEFLFAKQKSDYEILMGLSLADVGNDTKAAESLVKLNETYLSYSETNAELSRIKEQIESADGQNLSELEQRSEVLTKQRDKQRDLLKSIAAENGLDKLAASRREQLNRTTVKNALSELYDAYRQLKKSKSQYIQGVYSETVENRIEVIKDTLGGKTVSEMSNSELERLYEVYKMISSTVTGANKIFASDKKETVEETALKVMEEIERAGKNDSLISGKQAGDRNLAAQKAIDAKRGIEWEMLQPLTAFYKTGSKTFRELYNQALEGQNKWARIVAEFKAFAAKKRRQHGIWSIDESKVTEYTLESGERIKLTVPELMSVYALSRRDQGRKHLLVGGITLAENEIKTGEKALGVIDKRYGRDTARAYHLTEGDLSFLSDRLDDNMRKYVEEMQEYLSTVVAEKGNEVSRVLYGIDIFGEANYFPISSDRRFLFSSNKAVDAVSLKNIGMTKNTVPNAANPVVIASFDKVWNDHTAKMALYSSMVLPIENMNRVLNFTSYLSEADSSAYSRSVRTVLEENFGKSASKYFEQFVVDLNGGITGAKGGFWERAVSNMKKTAVAASLSVIVQQPTAIIRAFALINPKYFAGLKTQKEIAGTSRYEEIKRWAPIAIVKEIGGFDTGSGRAATDYIGAKEYSGAKNIVKGFFTDKYYRDEKFMVGAAKADELGWGIIWDAVKRESRNTTNLEFNSKEFLEACGKRFTDVIVQTQVYDSTLSRSSIMRNKSDIAKMATSFMGEPMTSYNMLYRAALDVNRSKGMAIGTSARAVAAVIGSMVAGAIVKALISAGRDDDDDESYADKYFQAVGGGLVDELNPLNLIPFARDLVTIIQGYDIDRADMTLFKDLWDAITKLDSDKISDYRKVENVVGSICNIFGLPVRNIMRDVRTAYNSAVSAFRPSSRSVGEALTEGITGKEITELDRYEALYDKEDLQGTKDLIKQMIEKEREKLLLKGEDQYEVNSKGQNKVNTTARANVRNKFSNRYRDEYKAAYKNKDTVTVAKIKTRLSLTGLYDDLDKILEDWRNAADEEVKKEKRAKEYAEKNK